MEKEKIERERERDKMKREIWKGKKSIKGNKCVEWNPQPKIKFYYHHYCVEIVFLLFCLLVYHLSIASMSLILHFLLVFHHFSLAMMSPSSKLPIMEGLWELYMRERLEIFCYGRDRRGFSSSKPLCRVVTVEAKYRLWVDKEVQENVSNGLKAFHLS